MERAAIDRHVRELDPPAKDLARSRRTESTIPRSTIDDVNLAVATGIVVAIGHISRFNAVTCAMLVEST